MITADKAHPSIGARRIRASTPARQRATCGGFQGGPSTAGGSGGGVGLRGIGDSGAAGTYPAHIEGYPGSQIDASDPAVGGGGSGYNYRADGDGDSGGVRILFGPGLTYPTGDR
jgi:hypothetical protein